MIHTHTLPPRAGITLPSLPLLPKVWRTSFESVDLRKCRLKDVCIGGDGSEAAANPGVQVPYCRVYHSGHLCEVGFCCTLHARMCMCCVEGEGAILFPTTSTSLDSPPPPSYRTRLPIYPTIYSPLLPVPLFPSPLFEHLPPFNSFRPPPPPRLDPCPPLAPWSSWSPGPRLVVASCVSLGTPWTLASAAHARRAPTAT